MTDNSSQFDDESGMYEFLQYSLDSAGILSADESVTIVTSETESEEESVKNRLSRTSRYRHRRRNTTKHGMDTTTLGKEERQQLNKDDRSHPTKQERKQFPSAHSGGEWNSHFCYIWLVDRENVNDYLSSNFLLSEYILAEQEEKLFAATLVLPVIMYSV